MDQRNIVNNSIGRTQYVRLTKEALIGIIEKTFPGTEVGCIAVVTTTNYGDFNNPTIMQSVTFGKVLEV